MTEIYWSRFSEDYDSRQEHVAGRPLIDAITAALASLPSLGRVAELGCGTGLFTTALTDNADSIIATDLSREQVGVAAARLAQVEGVTVLEADCTDTGLEPGAFDTVVAVNLLHVIPDPAAALAECRRLLAPGGRLVVVSFTNHGMSAWQTVKMAARFLSTWGKPPATTHAFSPESLGQLIDAAGFDVQEAALLGELTKAVFVQAHRRADAAEEVA